MTGPHLQLRIVGERTLLEGRAYDFVELTLRRADGTERTRPIVRHRGAVVVLPILEDEAGRRMLFVRNERHAINGVLEELPAGGLEPREDPGTAAGRELTEETGYAAASIVPLGRFYTTPGITDELMHAFVATGLRHVGQSLDEDEHLTVHARTEAEIWSMVDDGRLTDGKSILTLLLALRKGLLGSSG